jgi:dTDP-glucose 4,6-dehydratase
MSPGSAYGEGKRVAELLCAIYHRQHGIQTKIARCFAFVGPHLPLDKHFAIGNFIRDRLRGEPLRIQGDGTPYRSYLYAADLTVWLWTILFRGPACTPFNVGSEDAHTIREIAEAVTAALGPAQPVAVSRAAPEGGPRQRYVPSTEAARALLGLRPGVLLPDAIRKTAAWHEEEM